VDQRRNAGAGRLTLNRRNLIAMLGGVLAMWSLGIRAQQPERVRRAGVLMSPAESDPQGQEFITAFRGGLRALGWIEGRNLEITLRWAGGDVVRFRNYAAELVGMAPDLIVAQGTSAIAALKQATASIPIIFAVVNDPVAQGFISSMSHPGGNITGFSFLEYSIFGKSLEMLRQAAPGVLRLAVMFNPETYPYYNVFLRSFEATARKLSVEVIAAQIRAPTEIEEVIATLGAQPGSGLLVAPDPFTGSHRGPIISSTERHRVPAIYAFRQYVKEGALMSYGADAVDIMRRSASYVDRILKGADPGELPAQQPTKFELAINLKTAKALGLTVPASLLAVVDEVIE
jgi:putative tryptophan/tyrosine transport system substrate-binding protein